MLFGDIVVHVRLLWALRPDAILFLIVRMGCDFCSNNVVKSLSDSTFVDFLHTCLLTQS